MQMLTRIPLFALAILVVSGFASAQGIIGPELEKIPPATETFHSTTVAKMTPAVRNWVRSQATSAPNMKASPAALETTLRSSVATRFKGQALRAEHVDALLAIMILENI